MKEKEIEIRIGRDFAKDMGYLVDHPEEIKGGRKIIYVDSLEKLASIITAERFKLAQFIAEHGKMSINEIAQKLGRKREAVSRDLRKLHDFGLIKFDKKAQKVYPKVTATELKIQLKAMAK